MFGIRNGLSLCHDHHNRDQQQQEQDHGGDQQQQQRDPYSLSPSSAGGAPPSSAPSSPSLPFCFGGGIIGSKGVVNLLTMPPPSPSNRLSNINNNDLFVPVLDHPDRIQSSSDNKDQYDEEERDVDECEDGNDVQFDELDLQYENEHHQDNVDNEFETCSYIYEIDPALAAEKNGTFLRDSDEVSELTMKAFDGHDKQNGRRRHGQRRRLLSMKRFGRGITNRLPWRGSSSSSRQLEKVPASPSPYSPVPGIDKVETRDENDITASPNNKSVTQSPSSTCSILLIDPDSRQFEIVESPYTPNVSSCDEMLELPSLRSSSKSFRIRFQQYVGLVLFHLHTDDDGNTDVVDLDTIFSPGQTIPYLQQHQATTWRRQQHQQKKETPTHTISTPKHEELMLNISSWFSKKSFSSSASDEILKIVSKSSHDSPLQSQHKSPSPTASCPQTPTTVGTTIMIPSSVTPPEPAKLHGLTTTKRIRNGFGRLGGSGGEGTGKISNQNNNSGVVPLLVAIPNGLPTDEVKELAQNLLSFPQVLSTLIK